MAGERGALHTPVAASPLRPGWTWNRLDTACDGVFDCPHSTPVLTEAGPYLVRSQDIRSRTFRADEAAHVSEETYQERIARAEPRHGDLLYSREGTYFGIAAEVPQGLRLCLGQRMVLLRPRSSTTDSRFLLYWLNSPLMASHIHGFRDGSVAERLNMPTIRGLPVVLPPLPEQRAIAHILGTLNDKIELNRRMSETLGAMARALFKSWFVDFDPVRAKMDGRWRRGQSLPGLPAHLFDLFPSRLVDSELGEIPEQWEVTTVGAVAEVIDCLHSKKPERRDSGLPFLQLTNIRNDGLLDMSDTYLIDEVDYRNWVKRMEASPGDCVITNVGRVGAVSQIPTGQKAALGRNMTGVRCRCEFPFPTVMIEVLLSGAMKDEIMRKMDTGTILDALNVRNIPRLRFVRSTHEVLALFEESSRPLRARMEAQLVESRTLAFLRDTILPKLISGELRVKDAERFITRAEL